MSEYESAITCFERALDLDNANPFIWYNKGVVHSHLCNIEDAIECFDTVLKIDPSYDNAWINKGLMLSLLGKHENAIQCYDKINFDGKTRTAEKEAFVWNNKGIAHSHLGEYKEAVSCFAHALRIDPDYEEAKTNMQKVMSKLSSGD